MELITVALSAAQQEQATHVRAVAQGVVVGQGVVVQDEESAEFYAGTVVTVGEDCTVEVGERLTPSAALGAVTGLPNASSVLGIEQLADVVGRIRGSAVPLPKS